MGKSIISQARGHGSKTYQVRPNAYRYRIGYPAEISTGTAQVIKLINSAGHSAPLAKLLFKGNIAFFTPAAQGLYEGQQIEYCGEKIEAGNIVQLKNIPIGARIFSIETRPGDGGKMMRASGSFATILNKSPGEVIVAMPNKREIRLNEDCRATIGSVAGQGRRTKPVVTAGKKWHMMKARNKLWPRTSAVKVNAVDHPFGSGRGKRIKSKIAKRNAPAGAKVGHIRPRRTGIGGG